jgi:YggT family protein
MCCKGRAKAGLTLIFGALFMSSVFWLVNTVFDIYLMFIIIYVILSWLTAFGIINSYQPFVQSVTHFLATIIEPAARPIRNAVQRFLPSLGGIDLSILILWVLVSFLQRLVNEILFF